MAAMDGDPTLHQRGTATCLFGVACARSQLLWRCLSAGEAAREGLPGQQALPGLGYVLREQQGCPRDGRIKAVDGAQARAGEEDLAAPREWLRGAWLMSHTNTSPGPPIPLWSSPTGL